MECEITFFSLEVRTITNELNYEERFKSTVLEYLSYEDHSELQQMLSQSKFIIRETSSYTNVVWDQRSAVIEIKVPVAYRKIIEEKYKDVLGRACREVYEETPDYGYSHIELGVLLLSTVETKNHVDQTVRLLQNHANYQNLMDKVVRMDIDESHKIYIYEACNSAISGNNIAAITALGCATELLLIKLCLSYEAYLIDQEKDSKANAFNTKVTKARNASTRVEEFYKRIQSDEDMKIFNEYGFENMSIQFNLIDIIRQSRNDAGHPTGRRISNEDLSTLFGNFQFVVDKLYSFINDYPHVEVS